MTRKDAGFHKFDKYLKRKVEGFFTPKNIIDVRTANFKAKELYDEESKLLNYILVKGEETHAKEKIVAMLEADRTLMSLTLATYTAKALKYFEQGEDFKGAQVLRQHKSLESYALGDLSESIKNQHIQLQQTVSFTRFLRLVAQGLRFDAEMLLKDDPTFLLQSGDAIDTAGRRFSHVTALKYSQWSLDMDMSYMLTQYIPLCAAEIIKRDNLAVSEALKTIEIEKMLHQQCQELKEKGITYELCRAKVMLSEPTEDDIKKLIERKEILFIRDKDGGSPIKIVYCETNQPKYMEVDANDPRNETIIALVGRYNTASNILMDDDLNAIKTYMPSMGIKSQQFCEPECNAFQALTDAQTYYDENYDKLKRHGELDRYACQVIGLLQRELPAHGLYEYCHPERTFYYSKPAFNDDLERLREKKATAMPRSREIHNMLCSWLCVVAQEITLIFSVCANLKIT